MPDNSFPDKICNVCKHALNLRMTDLGVGWEHTEQDSPAGHDPEPISPPKGWRGRCDFCGTGVPTHVLPAKDFRVQGQNRMTGETWAACPECSELIEAANWRGLEARFAAEFRTRHGFSMARPARLHLRGLYTRLRRNVTGPLRPIEEPEEEK